MSKHKDSSRVDFDALDLCQLTRAQALRVYDMLWWTPIPNTFGRTGTEVVWGPPVCWISPPGSGKTSSMMAHARRHAAGFKNIKPGARGEGGVGMVPVMGPDGYLEFPAHGDLARAFAPGQPGTVLLDDINSNGTAMMTAMLDALQERQIGSWRSGGSVRWVAARNAVDEAANGADIPAAVANRSGHLLFPDPTRQDLIDYAYAMRFGGADEAATVDYAAREAEILAAWPAAFARALQVFSSVMASGAVEIRNQPKYGDPREQVAWCSPRTLEEFAVPGYAASILHRAHAEEAVAMVGAFIGRTQANAWFSHAASMDLPPPKAFLASIMAGAPTFLISMSRMDRTQIVARSCVEYVLGTRNNDEVNALWSWFEEIGAEHADLLKPLVGKLIKGGLYSGRLAAAKACAKMAYLVNE